MTRDELIARLETEAPSGLLQEALADELEAENARLKEALQISRMPSDILAGEDE